VSHANRKKGKTVQRILYAYFKYNWNSLEIGTRKAIKASFVTQLIYLGKTLD